MSTNESHVFFDAEGTLYVPKDGHSYADFWDGEHTLERAKKIFKLDNGVVVLLERLKKAGIPSYIVSKHREELLIELLEHFGILNYFDEVLVNGDKGDRIKEIAKSKKITLNNCTMLGDNYYHDVLPALRIGANAFIVDRDYNREARGPRIINLMDFKI